MKKLKLYILLLGTVLLFTSCSAGIFNLLNNKTMTGDRNVLGRTYPMEDNTAYSIIIKDIIIKDFEGVLIFDETLQDSVVITTDENIFMSLNVTTNGNTITVEGDSSYKYIPTTFEIAVGGLVNEIDIAGAFNADIKFDTITESNINLAGAADAVISYASMESNTISVAGAAKLNLSGYSNNFKANISGAAEINGYDLITEVADLTIAGASNVKLTVNDSLYVTMSGASSVRYKGTGNVMKSDINGLGEIINEND